MHVCVCSSVVQSHWLMQGWQFTHCFVPAVPGTHLEGETHTHRARSAILPQTDHIRPQVPPQQRDPAQRSKTRYVRTWPKRGVHMHTQACQESAVTLDRLVLSVECWLDKCFCLFQATSLSTRTWSCGWETSALLPSWRQSNRGKS